MNCTSCGAEIKEGASFCGTCGATVPVNSTASENAQPVYAQPQPQQNYQQNYQQASYQQPNQGNANYNFNNTVNLPPEYKPISMWGYIGYNFLFCIPLIGFILMIVFSCGGSSNVNVKNYARSYLCIILIKKNRQFCLFFLS